MNKTTINWCDYTWNVITGCNKIASGCKFCYAEIIAKRFWGTRKFTDVQFHEERLNDPKLSSKTPKRIFVNSMSDLFHESIDFEIIRDIMFVIKMHPQHTFLILTKRIKRALEFCNWLPLIKQNGLGEILPNLWLGYSASTPKDLDAGSDDLLKTDARIKWLSIEPMLQYIYNIPKVDWIVIGCESGIKRRPFYNDWAKEIISTNPTIPIWIKQIRDKNNKVIEDINLFPKELQLRELPNGKI